MVTKELLDHLKENFPNRCPKITESDREIWAHVGECNVITYLERLYEDLQENAMERKTLVGGLT